jgi:hypothetical protein
MTEQFLGENCHSLCLTHPKYSISSIVLTIQTGLWITILTHSISKPAYATAEIEEDTAPPSQQPAVPALSPTPVPKVEPAPSPLPATPVSFTPSTPSPKITPPPVSASASPPEVVPAPVPEASTVSANASGQQKSPDPQITSRPESPAAATQAAFSESTLPSEAPEVAAPARAQPARAQLEAPSTEPSLVPQAPVGDGVTEGASGQEAAAPDGIEDMAPTPEPLLTGETEETIPGSAAAPEAEVLGAPPVQSGFHASSDSSPDRSSLNALDAPYSTEAKDLLPLPEAMASADSVGADNIEAEAENQGNEPLAPDISVDSPQGAAPGPEAGAETETESEVSTQSDPPEAVAPGRAGTAATQGQSSPQVGYVESPVVVPPGVLNPLVTTIPFNSDVLEYGNRATVASGLNFGDDRSTNLRYAGLVNLNASVENYTTTDNIAVLEQRQGVVFVHDTLQERKLTLTLGDPITILGQDIQLSLTGSCLDPADGEICTFTPGLATEDGSIDPTTQLPTRFEQYSNFGDVVAPATLEAIQAPGFQRGTDEQQIGLDLRFPQIAVLPGNSQTDSAQLQRNEEFVTTPAIGYATVSQVVQANDHAATLARTVRGPAVIFDADQPITNYLLAALALALPEFRGNLPATTEPANPNINQSLFNAANNFRRPLDSLTLYQTGIGHAATPQAPLESSHHRPPARFHGIWLGLSPVTERSFEERFGTVPVGDRVQTLAAGGEGGGGQSADVIALVNGEQFDINNIDNIYTQNYVNLYEQDALSSYTFEQTDRIRYYPHLSLGGNITRAYDTFQYYAGTIAGDTIQIYGGLDYQGYTDDGWYYRAGGIGFLNPNYDRYSNLSGGVAKRFSLSDANSMVLGASLNWAIDQDTRLGDIEQTGEGSDITLQGRLNLGRVSLGVSQVLGDILPNSQASRTVLDTAVSLGENVTLAGFWAPFDNATSAPVMGLTADISFDMGDVSPGLIISWENSRYAYGRASDGTDLTTTSDVFEVLLRMQW